MAKFYGIVGFVYTTEDAPGSYVEHATEKNYFGDILRNSKQWQNSGRINDDINISNRISIVADPYVENNLYALRYVVWMGSKWKVTDVDATNPPRLVLTLGGVYNGN
jgi:hypothetical protein